MLQSAHRDRWFLPLRTLALLTLVSRAWVPLAHAPCVGGTEHCADEVVAPVQETGHDNHHDPDTCPLCSALRDSWGGGIEAPRFLAIARVFRASLRCEYFLGVARRLDLSTGTPRAPPTC